jgi:CRISPR-associated exonuclease Cas4
MSDRITGTLIWYAMICEREVWRMAHEMEPEREDARLEWGRFLGERVYSRSHKREISLSGMKLDLVENEGPQLVVAEVKSSSRFKDAARMQLLFYLWNLRNLGVEAVGELRFPEERRRERVALDAESEKRLQEIMGRVEAILQRPLPPPPKRTHFCRVCAYREFCWSDEED